MPGLGRTSRSPDPTRRHLGWSRRAVLWSTGTWVGSASARRVVQRVRVRRLRCQAHRACAVGGDDVELGDAVDVVHTQRRGGDRPRRLGCAISSARSRTRRGRRGRRRSGREPYPARTPSAMLFPIWSRTVSLMPPIVAPAVSSRSASPPVGDEVGGCRVAGFPRVPVDVHGRGSGGAGDGERVGADLLHDAWTPARYPSARIRRITRSSWSSGSLAAART